MIQISNFNSNYFPQNTFIHKYHVKNYNNHYKELFLPLDSERNSDHFSFLFGEKITQILQMDACTCSDSYFYPSLVPKCWGVTDFPLKLNVVPKFDDVYMNS